MVKPGRTLSEATVARARRWLFSIATLLVLNDAANAEDASSSTPENERLEWANYDPHREGDGVITLSGDLGILDPQRATGRVRTLSGGFGVSLLGRRKRWPVLVGLGIGVDWFANSRQPGPMLGTNRPEGGFYFGNTSSARSSCATRSS